MSLYKPMPRGARIFWTVASVAAFAYMIAAYVGYLYG